MLSVVIKNNNNIVMNRSPNNTVNSMVLSHVGYRRSIKGAAGESTKIQQKAELARSII
jgi:hypothetical protein